MVSGDIKWSLTEGHNVRNKRIKRIKRLGESLTCAVASASGATPLRPTGRLLPCGHDGLAVFEYAYVDYVTAKKDIPPGRQHR